jgi:hypothetical protein
MRDLSLLLAVAMAASIVSSAPEMTTSRRAHCCCRSMRLKFARGLRGGGSSHAGTAGGEADNSGTGDGSGPSIELVDDLSSSGLEEVKNVRMTVKSGNEIESFIGRDLEARKRRREQGQDGRSFKGGGKRLRDDSHQATHEQGGGPSGKIPRRVRGQSDARSAGGQELKQAEDAAGQQRHQSKPLPRSAGGEKDEGMGGWGGVSSRRELPPPLSSSPSPLSSGDFSSSDDSWPAQHGYRVSLSPDRVSSSEDDDDDDREPDGGKQPRSTGESSAGSEEMSSGSKASTATTLENKVEGGKVDEGGGRARDGRDEVIDDYAKEAAERSRRKQESSRYFRRKTLEEEEQVKTQRFSASCQVLGFKVSRGFSV